MVDLIVNWTDIKLASVREKYKNKNRPELKNTDGIEMKALFGLLIFTAVFKSNDEDIECILATDGTGRDIFRAVMSGKRFAVCCLFAI